MKYKNNPNQVIAARHICEEATKVLSTLRRGPPMISHGPLVHNLRELRKQVKCHFLDMTLRQPSPSSSSSSSHNDNDIESLVLTAENDVDIDEVKETEQVVIVENQDAVTSAPAAAIDDDDHGDTNEEKDDVITFTDSERYEEATMTLPPPPPPAPATSPRSPYYNNHNYHQHHLDLVNVGPYAQPFLDIILDPRAAGPHTLIALRSLHRLVSRQSLTLTSKSTSGTKNNNNTQTKTFDYHHTEKERQPSSSTTTTTTSAASILSPLPIMNQIQFQAEMEPLMRGILECRFEQTDAGADEAVEMAIADLLSLIVSLDTNRQMNSEVIMEAFNTVFVTRNTFVHSPALCYHFEQVLDGMIRDLFCNLHVARKNYNILDHCAMACKLIMEFLVSQLLHTPMTYDDTGNNIIRTGSMEAFTMHNDTRILCLRLIQTCLKTGCWGSSHSHEEKSNSNDEEEKGGDNRVTQQQIMTHGVLKIIQDDLCLSLLLVGQGIWAYQDPTSGALPGMISMNVLAEICSTISTLWSIESLRNVLTTQFENIFTGFYQRALSLLRRLPVPQDSATFHANQIFDAEVEIILETLIDILSFNSDDNMNLGTFETLFVTYDCNMNRPDVAAGLLEELTRCCYGFVEESVDINTDPTRPPNPIPTSRASTPIRQSSHSSLEPDYEPQIRDVPSHLKELCAEAITGVMKTLFRDSTNSSSPTEILPENQFRSIKEKKLMMRNAVELFNEKSSKSFAFMVANGLLEEPVTPEAVASFLRSGLVLGLDKRAVGEYLGEKGKSPVAGKSPPSWERDWFHKETLSAYCSSFHFRNQSLLDGLRMFLAAFRLPGEAQQIDRILQAFAESCGLQCEESQNGSLRLFSTDPKKASDAAYLLSFSIIMLNTDLHNKNIRPDRKMKVEDFVKNNTDYGKDITDPDKKLPREYLEGIYDRIKYEHIRTEGEGADGIMTFERWKDVMRNLGEHNIVKPSSLPRNEISHLVVEIIQDPIFSTICGFWGMSFNGEALTYTSPQNIIIGVQGAKFGMNLAYEMMKGLKNFASIDLFQDFFIRICKMTGLLGDYNQDSAERTLSFVDSVERQSAVVVVMKVASNFGDFLGIEGWSCVLGIIFELRDLKLLGGGTQIKHHSLIIETDPDLLRPDTRRDWEMRLVKQCYNVSGVHTTERNRNDKKRSGLIGAMGRAIFGSEKSDNVSSSKKIDDSKTVAMGKSFPSKHGKEELILWDDLALSDEEDELETEKEDYDFSSICGFSLGDDFEKQLFIEDNNQSQLGPPITGLETYEDTRVSRNSPRARVRKRLSKLCNFSMIISETRFLDSEGVKALLQALIQLIGSNISREKTKSETHYTLSPGSEALAEVMITEVALKNRDRIAALWSSCLASHYYGRLLMKKEGDITNNLTIASVDLIPGIEKCITGLLRLCYHNVHREEVNNEILLALKLLSPYCASMNKSATLLGFEKHISEGLWRICRDVDGLSLVSRDGWDGILHLMTNCARGGEKLLDDNTAMFKNLSDDDPALQAFRCMHLIIHSVELREVVPLEIINSVKSLVSGGEKQHCPKLSLAGLDLLLVLHTRLHVLSTNNSDSDETGRVFNTLWMSIIEGIAEASDSQYTSTRQHSMSIMRDILVDKCSEDVAITDLGRIFNGVCMPAISQRLSELVQEQNIDQEEIMIELELCISIIFKPFMHHLEKLRHNTEEFTAVWMSVLSTLSHLLGKVNHPDDKKIVSNHRFLKASKDVATEHLRHSIMTLISKDILKCDDDITSSEDTDISSMTWNALSNITYCKDFIPEWRQSKKQGS